MCFPLLASFIAVYNHFFLESSSGWAFSTEKELSFNHVASPLPPLPEPTHDEPRPRPRPPELQGKRVIYSNARPDRSGAGFLDMITAHAYATFYGLEYGGACGKTNNTNAHQAMIQYLGLEQLLRFDCPRSNETDVIIVPMQDYLRGNMKKVFTREWLEYFRAQLLYPKIPPKTNNRPRVAVHIRRGDVTPCMKEVSEGTIRYLPNDYYMELIEAYAPQDANVTVYTESESFEPLYVFQSKKINLNLDGSLQDVWREFLMSDVLILSKSSFSFAPAILAKNTTKVIYTPFWHDPLPGWVVADSRRVAMADRKTKAAHQACPPKQ
jgi:hypothetical protein